MRFLLQRLPRPVLILIGLAAFGFARLPFESSLNRKLSESNLLLPAPAEGVIQQMSQSALMGTLGGLRTLVGTYLVLEAFEHFSLKEWEDLRRSYLIITSLEPRDENHWRDVVWHLGINATADMQNNRSLPPLEKERRFNQYCLEAITLGEDGIQQLPESVIIRQQLAEVYRQKLRDNCETARLYGEIKDLPGAPGYARRFHAYYLARCPGQEGKAYDYLMDLYREGERQRLPTLIVEIKKLEEILRIPHPQRIPDPHPDLQRRNQSQSMPGGIVVP